jgi:outer membrane protein assembly factor BamA
VLHSIRILLVLCCVAGSFSNVRANHTFAADTIKRNPKNILRDTSRYVAVNRVLIIGNKRTKNSIISRELTLKPGDIVWHADLVDILEKDKRKLFNLHLFHTATIRILDAGIGSIDLLVEVEERWYVFPIPIFRLSDRNFNEWWENYNHDFDRVNYGLKWYQYNMWGRNHTLLLTAQFGFQRRFEFVYRVPYLNKQQKQGLIFEMDYIDSKNIADSTVNHKLDFFRHDRILRKTKGMGLTYTYRNNF